MQRAPFYLIRTARSRGVPDVGFAAVQDDKRSRLTALESALSSPTAMSS